MGRDGAWVPQGALGRAGAVGPFCPCAQAANRRLQGGKRRHSAFIGVSSHLIQQKSFFLKIKCPVELGLWVDKCISITLSDHSTAREQRVPWAGGNAGRALLTEK